MALPFNPDLKVAEASYNDKEYLGIETIDNLRRSGPADTKEFLNSLVTYAYGNFDKNFPLLMKTQGANNKKGISATDGIYRAQILGKPKSNSVVAKTIHQPNAQTGKGNIPFEIIFRDRWFMKNQILIAGGLASDNVQLQVSGLPKREAKGWRYTVRIIGGDGTQSVPFRFLQAGAVWGGSIVAVSLEHSRGTESRSYSPYQIKNNLSLLRQSINVAGNAAKKKMVYTINVDGKQINLAYDWEKYLTEKKWNVERDLDLVISKPTFNTETGEILNFDSDSGKAVYRGMGLWWQIPTSNEMTYSFLTENLIENYITDMLSITQNLDRDSSNTLVIDVFAGFGFLQELDKALKRNVSLLSQIGMDSNLVVSKNSDGGLTSGAYFTRYRHRSGVEFKFTSYPGFDYGALADSSERHPISNLPMSSYYAMIMNFDQVSTGKSSIEGNIMYVYEEGREYYEGTVRGMAAIEGKQGGEIATDIDASALHMIASQGIHVNYPMALGKMVCKLS